MVSLFLIHSPELAQISLEELNNFGKRNFVLVVV